MLRWAVAFLAVTIVAFVFGWTSILVEDGLVPARILFFVFLVMFVVTLILGEEPMD